MSSLKKYEEEDSDNEFVLHEDDPEYALAESKKKTSTLSVEKIIGRKVVTPTGAAVNGNTNNANPSTNTELFYIKWKGLSYLHARYRISS